MKKNDHNNQRIRELYERYTNAMATKEELAEFFKLSTDPANESVFESLMSGSWDELYEKGHELQRLKSAPVRKLQPGPISKWSAAVVILLVGLSTYFFVSKKTNKSEQPIAITKANDVAPGSNKATLILSTGQQIILDSAKNGQLARFGNTTITKTDSGKLLYALTDNTSSGSVTNNNETSFNTLTTPRGGVYELTLPDGTKAWLNAASRIDYPTRFTGKKREVFINGEVYFEVAHDAAHPFLVSLAAKTHDQEESAHWMQIEVLGTHFNVNTYSDNTNENPNATPDFSPTRTTLLEGSVKISAHGNGRTIKPGEQAITGFNSNGIEVNKNIDVDKVMAWRYGKMILTNGTVHQVMTEISRWYDMDIEYKGSVPNKQFYGSVRRDVPLSTVLHALQAYGVETRVEGKKIIVQ